MSDDTLNLDDFKGAMGSWAAGVTVVTTELNGKVYGLTVSSFSSLSVEPVLVLACIMNSNNLAEMVKDSQKFGISILAEGQDDISNFFSKSGREPVESYTDFPTETWATGSPLVSGAIAHVDCEVHELLPGGDHTILVGKVVAARYEPEKMPLIYFRRGYRPLNMD